MPPRITIIEDEPDVVQLVSYCFQKEGFRVESFSYGREGLEQLRREPPDLVLLDVMLPDIDGFEICRRMRADDQLQFLPVIFLTAKGSEIDRVLGLEIGADYYVVKQFSTRELLARVKAVLRRKENSRRDPEVLDIGDLKIDYRTHEVTVRGKPINLTTLEFKLLHFLAAHPGHIFSRDGLLDHVWGGDRFVSPRTVDVHIWRLREKIEENPDTPRILVTVRGAGYRLSDPRRFLVSE